MNEGQGVERQLDKYEETKVGADEIKTIGPVLLRSKVLLLRIRCCL
jgi:hypothetical protein